MYLDMSVTLVASVVIGWNLGTPLIPLAWGAALALAFVLVRLWRRRPVRALGAFAPERLAAPAPGSSGAAARGGWR
jgi:hypothetical protein